MTPKTIAARARAICGASVAVFIAAAATSGTTQAVLSCGLSAEIKNVTVFDKPDGTEIGRMDKNPGWSISFGFGIKGVPDTPNWVAISDQGKRIGWVKVGQGDVTCGGGF